MRGRLRRCCWIGFVVASLMAFLIVAMVTLPDGRALSAASGFLLGVDEPAAGASDSAISTARRQMSSARRASPLTAATFRLANWMASGSTMSPGTPSRRDCMIFINCSWL